MTSHLPSLLLAAFLSAAALAAPAPSSLEGTIEHLINYTADSNRVFVRNGKEHPSSEAARLIRYKYEHSKDQIHTAEDFIRIAATKSSTTGEPYLLKTAEGKLVPVAQWLTEALRRYRTSAQ